MKNVLLETIVEGVAFTVGVSVLVISSMQIIASAGISPSVPSFLVENISHYGILAVLLSILTVAATYIMLKMKNSALSKGFFILGGVSGIMLCGVQIIIAQGNLMQIGLAAVLAYICYLFVSKGIKR